MPIYEYGCENCGRVDEVLQGISEEGPKTCRFCGKGPVKRLISKSSFHLKGSGWYVTDYGGKNTSGAKEEKSASDSVPAGSVSDNKTSGSED